MPVRELLATHTSQELAEWQAFELLNGFEDVWTAEALADIQQQLQVITYLTGAQFCDEDDDDGSSNPVPRPQRYPRRGDRRARFSFELDDMGDEAYKKEEE